MYAEIQLRFNFMATTNYLFCEFLNSVSGAHLTCIYMCKHEGNAVNMTVRRKLTF